MGVTFPVSEAAVHTLSATVTEDSLLLEADGTKMSLYLPGIYPTFHLGINACEGINRFYSLEVEEG